MFIWTQEIEIIEENSITLKNGSKIQIENKNKNLLTEEPLTWSELQMKWAQNVATDIIDVLHENNVRLTDIWLIMNLVNDIISGKNDEALASAFWKDNLDVISNIFWSNENLASIAVRNIRMKDIFKS